MFLTMLLVVLYGNFYFKYFIQTRKLRFNKFELLYLNEN